MATSQPVPPAGRTLDFAVHAVEVTKTYGDGPTAVTALDRVSTAFGRRRFTAVMGPSGSGKSTLLHCIAGLDTVDAGEIRLGDVDLTRLDERALTRLRRERVGFVFQAFNLLPTLTAARALAARPEVVFADEPTGNLDSRSSAELLGFLRRSVEELGQTIVMVTHDPVAAGHADEVVFLADGRVVDLMAAPTAERVLDRMKALGG
jgi:putative ABC transport system ATP-binding protein